MSTIRAAPPPGYIRLTDERRGAAIRGDGALVRRLPMPLPDASSVRVKCVYVDGE